jgi:hypothetical protein
LPSPAVSADAELAVKAVSGHKQSMGGAATRCARCTFLEARTVAFSMRAPSSLALSGFESVHLAQDLNLR